MCGASRLCAPRKTPIAASCGPRWIFWCSEITSWIRKNSPQWPTKRIGAQNSNSTSAKDPGLVLLWSRLAQNLSNFVGLTIIGADLQSVLELFLRCVEVIGFLIRHSQMVVVGRILRIALDRFLK